MDNQPAPGAHVIEQADHEADGAQDLFADVEDAFANYGEGDECWPSGPQLLTIEQLRAQASAEPPRWLINGIWSAGDHMVVGADAKVGKSLAMVDLAIALASGTPFLGALDTGAPVAVAMFCAEDSAGEVLRRLDAVAEAKGLRPDPLPIMVGSQVPQLDRTHSLADLRRLLERHRPAVVILDPLYLAVGGASGASLYEMGALLGQFGRICRAAGASAVVVHHWNKRGVGTGTERLSGTGTTQWGRVLASVSTRAAPVGCDGHAANDLVWEFSGNSLAPRTLVVRREVWAESDDPRARMHYSCRPIEGGASPAKDEQRQRILEHMAGLAEGEAASFTAVRDAVGGDRKACRENFDRLVKEGRIALVEVGSATRYRAGDGGGSTRL